MKLLMLMISGKKIFTNLKKFTKDLENFFFIILLHLKMIFNIQYLRLALINTAKELKDHLNKLFLLLLQQLILEILKF